MCISCTNQPACCCSGCLVCMWRMSTHRLSEDPSPYLFFIMSNLTAHVWFEQQIETWKTEKEPSFPVNRESLYIQSKTDVTSKCVYSAKQLLVSSIILIFSLNLSLSSLKFLNIFSQCIMTLYVVSAFSSN